MGGPEAGAPSRGRQTWGVRGMKSRPSSPPPGRVPSKLCSRRASVSAAALPRVLGPRTLPAGRNPGRQDLWRLAPVPPVPPSRSQAWVCRGLPGGRAARALRSVHRVPERRGPRCRPPPAQARAVRGYALAPVICDPPVGGGARALPSIPAPRRVPASVRLSAPGPCEVDQTGHGTDALQKRGSSPCERVCVCVCVCVHVPMYVHSFTHVLTYVPPYACVCSPIFIQMLCLYVPL